MNDLGSVLNAGLIVLMTIVLTWFLKDRFDAVNKQFEGVDKRFDAVDKRFDAVDKRFDAVDKRMDGLETEITALKIIVAGIQGRQEELSREFVGLRSDIVQIA